MDPGLEERELEDPLLRRPADGRVGVVAGIGRGRPERQDDEVGAYEDDRDSGGGRPAPGRHASEEPGGGEREQRCEGERGDRNQPAGNAGEMEGRKPAPDGLVDRRVRAEREDERYDCGQSEHERRASGGAARARPGRPPRRSA